MEEIDLPLSKGTLDDIPIEEVSFRTSLFLPDPDPDPVLISPVVKAAAPAAPMDVDGPEEGTQNIFEANDYGVEVDFDELDEGEQEVNHLLFVLLFLR